MATAYILLVASTVHAVVIWIKVFPREGELIPAQEQVLPCS